MEDKAADSKLPTGALAEKEAAKHAAPARPANPEKASKTFAALLGEKTAQVKDAAPEDDTRAVDMAKSEKKQLLELCSSMGVTDVMKLAGAQSFWEHAIEDENSSEGTSRPSCPRVAFTKPNHVWTLGDILTWNDFIIQSGTSIQA